uniref:RRM domain-containing protein n=1 Tax=Solanum lycopersicum TaxID=4081 RepID=A0A3Q7IRC0_SOLLC
MSGKDHDYRIFVGGLAWDVTDRQLEGAFGRYGKIIDCQLMDLRCFRWNCMRKDFCSLECEVAGHKYLIPSAA